MGKRAIKGSLVSGQSGFQRCSRANTAGQSRHCSSRDRTVVWKCRDCEFNSCFCILHSTIYFSFITLTLVLKGTLSGTCRIFTIRPPVNLSLGSCLGNQNRLSWSQGNLCSDLSLKLFCSSLQPISIPGGFLEKQNLRPTRLGSLHLCLKIPGRFIAHNVGELREGMGFFYLLICCFVSPVSI